MNRDITVNHDNLTALSRLRAEFSGRAQILILVSFGLCIILGLFIVAKMTKLLIASAHASQSAEAAAASKQSNLDQLQRSIAHSTEIADQLKKHNLFAPPLAPKNPVTQVAGILGDAAYISGAWRKVGDKIGDVEIIAIEPTSVTILWNGSERILAPIAAAVAQDSSRSRPSQRPSDSRPTAASYTDNRYKSSSKKYRPPTSSRSSSSSLSAKEIARQRAQAAKSQTDKLQKIVSNRLDSAKKKVSSKVKSTAKAAARPPKKK